MFGRTEFSNEAASAVATSGEWPLALGADSENSPARLRMLKLKPQSVEQRRGGYRDFQLAGLSIPVQQRRQGARIGLSFSAPHAFPHLPRFVEQRQHSLTLCV